MKSQHLLALVFRVLGTIFLFQIFVLIPTLGFSLALPSPSGMGGWFSIGPQIAALFLSIIGAYVFLFHALRLAERVVPCDELIGAPEGGVKDADSVAVFRLLLRVVGAIAVAWAVPELVGQGFGSVKLFRVTTQHVWTAFLPGVVKLSIGLYLLRGGDQVVQFAYRSQDASKDDSSG